jgi:hypothetical protein
LKNGGVSAGILDVYYWLQDKMYRSRVEAAISIGLLPYARTIKSMPRYLHALLAVEMREKHIISHQLLCYQGELQDIQYEGDEIVFFPPQSNASNNSNEG